MIAPMLMIVLLLSATVPGAKPSVKPACHDLTDTELRSRVDAFLRSVDVAVEADTWKALGPRAVPLLEDLARDGGALPTRRAQALSALVHLRGPDAAALLSELAAREQEALGVRLAAVRALGAATTGDGGGATLRLILERSGDARVRVAAAEQLIRKNAGDACAAVLARVAAEDLRTRPLFSAVLQKCPPR